MIWLQDSALPEPTPWQFLSAFLGLFLQRHVHCFRSRRLYGGWHRETWCSSWLLGAGLFYCSRLSLSLWCPPWSLPWGSAYPRAPQSQPPVPPCPKPRSCPLQQITPVLPCSQGSTWLLFGGAEGLLLTPCSTCSHCSLSDVSLQNTHTHIYTYMYINTDVFIYIYTCIPVYF